MGDKSNTSKTRRQWKKAFLEGLQNSANVRAACQAAGIARKTAYEHYHNDSKFAAEWDEALESACDILEARAWERSKTSDQVLMFLLRAHRPQKYTEKIRQELSGDKANPVAVSTVIELRAVDYRNGINALAPGTESEQ